MYVIQWCEYYVLSASRYGYVEFNSVEKARKNLKMNGMELRGQHLNINLASSQDKCKIRVSK